MFILFPFSIHLIGDLWAVKMLNKSTLQIQSFVFAWFKMEWMKVIKGKWMAFAVNWNPFPLFIYVLTHNHTYSHSHIHIRLWHRTPFQIFGSWISSSLSSFIWYCCINWYRTIVSLSLYAVGHCSFPHCLPYRLSLTREWVKRMRAV